ncbi:MAG: zinc-ribbon domain-containing protein [Proteobacteria bacterium]|nr:zinc-ribbon domain-containing protein [Pseudomonadota bacterium]
MRIVCDQCQQKYTVPDDKIVKNVLRMTCQKCGHVITTRVNASSAEQTSSPSNNTLDKWRASSTAQPATRRPQNEKPSWYYSYNGESFGPFTEQELTQKLLSEKLAPIAEHCFVWHKTLSEWKPVMQVEQFANAISAPPPPPAQPAPKPANPNMPPLLNDDSEATQQMRAPMFSLFSEASSNASAPKSTTSNAQLTGKSSPDVPSLKQRLQSSNSHASVKPRFEFPVPKSKTTQAVADAADDEEEAGDTTRVGSPSPFFSFQSLDAISSDIKPENKGGKSLEMIKPFPTLSGIAPISKDKTATNVTARPGFESTSAGTGINALLGNASKSHTVPKISSMRSGGTPILNSESAVAKNLQTTSAVTQKSPIPAVTAAAKTTALEEMPDFQEDIGSIVASQTPLALLQAGEDNRTDSISSWLPSASDIRLDSRVEGLSLPDISLTTSAEQAELNPQTSDIELDGIDLDDDSSQIFDKNNIHLDNALNSTNDLGTISLDDDSSVLPTSQEDDSAADDEEQKIVTGAQMLNMVRQSASHKSIERDIELASADLAEIDLDDEDSQFIAANVIEDAISEEPKKSGIVGSTDDLFGEQPETEQSVAKVRASHHKLDDIAAKYADIFDLPDPEPQHSEDGISENSMMIQLAHFQKTQEKEKRKTNTALIIAAIVAVLIVFACVAGGIVLTSETETETQKTSFAKVEGRSISSDELSAIAPIEDFEIVASDEPAPKTKSTRTRTQKNNTAKANATAEENTKQPIAEETAAADAVQPEAPSANEDVMAALYGNDAPAAPSEDTDKPMAIPANKKDGRANIVLKSAGDFANTDAVKGSKYGQLNAGSAATSRELFSIGLRSVSQTVQECHKREAKTGNMMIPKIYLRLTVEPSGVVSSFEVEEKEVPASFNKCLEGKKDRWKFAPFEGNAVKMRQGFVLG